MRFSKAAVAGSALCFCVVGRAVYAPIPEQEQAQRVNYSVEAGFTYNTNIFGAATAPIASWVYELSPDVKFNGNVSDATFVSAEFHPTLDYFDSRPGQKTLYSQAINARVASKLADTSVIDVSDAYSYDQNPEVLLNGLPVNTNQTLQSNQFDGRYTFTPIEKLDLVLKARSTYYDYTDAALGDLLNRYENTYGLEFDYATLPTLKLAGEYRHQDTDYITNPGQNNKHTDFLMAGFDYTVGPKLTASVRVGAQYRHYEGGISDSTTPYTEASVKYDYAKGSFVSAGYSYTFEETSNPQLFLDEKVNRMFVNVQHALSPLVTASASIDYEPASLDGKTPQPGISEDTTRAGVALTYLITKNWTVSASYDYDFVDSGISNRGMNRSRYGVSGTVVF